MAYNFNSEKITLLDGAMGSFLQKLGLKAGELPEMLNITRPDDICAIHKKYLEAGSDVIYTNTFGINRFKAEAAGISVEQVVKAAVQNARNACNCFDHKAVALDIGPCGRVLKPAGDLEFEQAVKVFAEIVKAGSDADFIIFETFTDLYELKAAVIAAKESSTLPIAATMSFEEGGRTFFGATIETMAATLEALGVSAVGINCSLGPRQIEPLAKRLLAATNLPVIIKPNAGLPVLRNGETVYDVTKEEFAEIVAKIGENGAALLGGCCGTTPEYIKLLANSIKSIKYPKRRNRCSTTLCSASKLIAVGEKLQIIGERINPTGKKRLAQALREKDYPYILREAVRQQEQGAAMLDVNAGLPDIDEAETLKTLVSEIQAVTDLPLQLDSSDPKALEQAARIYNGKPLINSVNGKQQSLDTILPIAKKYGCAVLGLTLDEQGIPETAERRIQIAHNIITAAESYGIPREDILIDCLTMTISAQQSQAVETLRAMKEIKEKYSVHTVLGISNISFGLPARKIVNETMLSLAAKNGLDLAIYNPAEIDPSALNENEFARRALLGEDKDCEEYIKAFADFSETKTETAPQTAEGLEHAVLHGLKEEAKNAAAQLLAKETPIDIVEKQIVPALDKTGKLYESGRLFLPQLIKAAEAAKAACDIVRAAIASSGQNDGNAPETLAKKQKIVLATVKGDIHDIGKNIAKVILENYGYSVVDLGKDVAPQKVLEAVKEHNATLVGLSALMTTTVENMKQTITLLKEQSPQVKIMVGGAVVSAALANEINADFYVPDALSDVRVAQRLFGDR